MRWFFKSDYKSFYLLNITQFLGAFNDNIFKLLVIFLLINVKGSAAAPKILSLAGAIFVIPFLLFSSGAGVLADRISKRSILVVAKVLELLIMVVAVFAVFLQSAIGSYVCLFFMAAQSALFGPSKYGIIPELVDEKMVSKANGALSSMTYLAIILGTFFASLLTDLTNKNFFAESLVCVGVAVIGLLTCLGIARTEPRRSPKKINPFFPYEIYQTLKISWKIPHLTTAIFAESFFLFIGAFTQLNIIPFAIQSLGMDEVGGGYLFVATAVGIAIGAVISGQLSKDKVEPGISCICCFFITLFFFTLYFFASSLICTVISLIFLGMFGGGFLIPFDAFLQVYSPDEKRGRIIATSNFFSFVGVLAAAFVLFILSEELRFSAASGFAVMGIITFIAAIIISGKLSSFFLSFFVQKILKRFRRLYPTPPLPTPNDLVILQSKSWWDAILLFACLPNLVLLIPSKPFRHFPWMNGWMDSIRLIPLDPKPKMEELKETSKKFKMKNRPLCIFFHKQEGSNEMIDSYKEIFSDYNLIYAHGIKERIQKRFFYFRFYQKQITMKFSREE